MKLPTPQEVRAKLSPDQIEDMERLARSLEASHGPAPAEVYVVGWVWMVLAEAQVAGLSARPATRVLDAAYLELLAEAAAHE